MCDLSYTLFESENVNGAYFCSNYTAKEWVNKNFEYIGEIAEEIKFQFDSDYANKILLDIFAVLCYNIDWNFMCIVRRRLIWKNILNADK